MTRPYALLLSLLAATALLASCGQVGCPNGSTREGDLCVPIDCDASAGYFADEDRDGYGDPATATCGMHRGYVAVGGDCDDVSPDVHPGVTELCNGRDDDCDGAIDQTFACMQSMDSPCQTACNSTGTIACSDTCTTIGTCAIPVEQCNAIDDDCDGSIDESLLELADVGSAGEAGDQLVGVVRSPSGYVIFLRRAGQVLAQELDVWGVAIGDAEPMLDTPVVALRAFDVAATSAHAYVPYVVSHQAFVRRYDFATGTFDRTGEVFSHSVDIPALRVAASETRVVAIFVTGHVDSVENAAVRVVSFGAALDDRQGERTLVAQSTPTFSLAFGIGATNFAGEGYIAIAPPAPGSTRFAAVYRSAPLATTLTVLGLDGTAATVRAAQDFDWTGSTDSLLGAFRPVSAEEHAAIVGTSNINHVDGAFLRIKRFAPSTIDLSPSPASQEALHVAYEPNRLAVAPWLGRFVVAFVEDDGTPRLQVGLFDMNGADSEILDGPEGDVTRISVAADDGDALVAFADGANAPRLTRVGCSSL